MAKAPRPYREPLASSPIRDVWAAGFYDSRGRWQERERDDSRARPSTYSDSPLLVIGISHGRKGVRFITVHGPFSEDYPIDEIVDDYAEFGS